MEVERIGILLGRKLSGEITLQEQEELNRLLEAYPDEVDMDTYRKLHAGRLSEVGREDAEEAAGVYWEKQREQITISDNQHKGRFRSRKVVSYYLAAACIAVLFVLITWNLSERGQESGSHLPEMVTVTTKQGEKTTLTLPEGTVVTLNENSEFRYNKNMDAKSARNATLLGEAYFVVAHFPESPFTVHTAKMDIRVLGTTFNVQAYENDKIAEATLFEGKIEVHLNKGPQGKRKIQLQPLEKLTIENPQPAVDHPVKPDDTISSRVTQFTVSEIAQPAEENLYKENAWVAGKVVFTDEPLATISAFLEEKHGVKVHFMNPSIGDKRIRGVFVDGSLESVLDALQFTVGFQYAIKGKEVLIY